MQSINRLMPLFWPEMFQSWSRRHMLRILSSFSILAYPTLGGLRIPSCFLVVHIVSGLEEKRFDLA